MKKISPIQIAHFRRTVRTFFNKHGRELPWRKIKNPYYILVSEIMLQQTQVDRTIPKFKEFVTLFPTIDSLANASPRKVLQAWQGMGYNRRALNLQKCAQAISKQYKGKMPEQHEELIALPGIGPYTAKAIIAFAFNKPVVLIETNVRAVYLHHFFPNKKKISDAQILPLIEQTVDTKNPRQWYSALMDYGSYLKKAMPNPSRRSAHHVTQSKFEGSLRQARGAVVRSLLNNGDSTMQQIAVTSNIEVSRIRQALQDLQSEGVVVRQGSRYSLAS